MRRVLVLLTLIASILAVASVAMAEHKTIDPFSRRTGAIQPQEHATIDPWAH